MQTHINLCCLCKLLVGTSCYKLSGFHPCVSDLIVVLQQLDGCWLQQYLHLHDCWHCSPGMNLASNTQIGSILLYFNATASVLFLILLEISFKNISPCKTRWHWEHVWNKKLVALVGISLDFPFSSASLCVSEPHVPVPALTPCLCVCLSVIWPPLPYSPSTSTTIVVLSASSPPLH